MRYFSVYDIVLYKAKQKEETFSQVVSFFKSRGINKAKLISLKESGMIPTDRSFLNAILDYLEMSLIELELSLGRMPSGYEEVYFNKIKDIANLLIVNNKIADEEKYKKVNKKEPTLFFTTKLGKLYNGDCLNLFEIIEDNTVDCIFADPPFNLKKEYDENVNDNKTYSQYIDWCMQWLDQCVRVLKPNGSLFIYNIPKWNTYLSNYLNNKLNFWDWITLDMKFNFPIANRLYPAHYSLLYYVKGNKPKTFNSQRLPLPVCRHCGGELKDYGGYKSKMNPNGVNLSDVWTDIYPVRHRNTKTRKYNELPVKLLDRIISLSTKKGDLVLDPFGGSGTTYAVCELLERKWIGFEIGNCDIIKERLLNSDKERDLLDKIYDEKNTLFPRNIQKLRKRNGFWLDTDFHSKSKTNKTKKIFEV
jgi:site-specific DNA-methyltransferase (adenine-specific)